MSHKNRSLNIFTWATSELSQDAFLCWILSWACPDKGGYDKNIHYIAQCFLDSILSKCKTSFGCQDIASIKVKKQEQNIDLWAQITLKNRFRICATYRRQDKYK